MSRVMLCRFQDPPSPGSGGHPYTGHRFGGARPDPEYAKAAALCRVHPKRWMLLARFDSSRAAEAAGRSVNNGTGAWSGPFEATRRGRELYVRFTGSPP